MAEGTVTLPVVSQSRAPAGQVEVPAAVVAGPVREHLLHAAVQSQMAGRRGGTAATKTKGVVSGGGTKPWRQKRTGRARADEAIQRAARNLPHVKVLVAQGLNVYDVLGHAHLVLTRAALETVAGRLGGRA